MNKKNSPIVPDPLTQEKSIEELTDDEMMMLVSAMMQAATGMNEAELIMNLKEKYKE